MDQAVFKDKRRKRLCLTYYIENVGKAFLKEFGHDASFYVTQIGDGGREIR